MPEKMNIYQKLAKARKTVEVIQKNAKGYGYTYVTEDEILSRLTVAMDKYGLLLIPAVNDGTFIAESYTYAKTKVTKTGEVYEEKVNEIITKADMTFTWVDVDDPDQRVVVPWAMVGHQTDGSQGFGTALSYAYRYFLLKFFGVATTSDDPDAWRTKQKESEAEQDRIVASAIISDFDAKVKAFLADHADQSEAVKKLASKYAKGGNYFSIKESTTAAKLLEEFDKSFVAKG